MNSEINFITHQLEELYRVKEILANGFVPNFHAEDLRLGENLQDRAYMGIPMVSFSDLTPITLLKHIEGIGKSYGKYVIALKREWALDAKWMNPVWYITEAGLLDTINRNFEEFLKPEFLVT